MIDWSVWVGSAVAVLVLVAVASIALRLYGVPRSWAPATAIARAVLQLGALSLVLVGIITSPLWVAIGLGVMFVAAVFTAWRRSGGALTQVLPLAAAMACGAGSAITVAFVSGAVEFSPRYVLAVGGIVLGNTMTVAILAERNFRVARQDHWDEVEGWLALGAPPQQATERLARLAVTTSLLPSIDQTRTTGIVVLPGAFVGAVFAGASPLEAGRFQLIVLASVLTAGALTSIIVTALAGRQATRP